MWYCLEYFAFGKFFSFCLFGNLLSQSTHYWTFFVSPSANIDPHSAPGGKALTLSLKSDVKFAVGDQKSTLF
jgi:hypothetical protein